MVHGNESMRPCGPKFGRPKAATQHLARAIIDSQSVKTTEKGGLVAMTLARRSTVESDTSL